MRCMSFSAAVLFCGLAFGADETSDRERLAADLLDAMNMEAQVSQSFETAKAAFPAHMKQMQSFLPAGPNGEKRGLPTEQTNKMMDKMLGMLATEMSWEKVKADYVALYADTFTAAELEELLAFYRSPAGKSFVAKQPELARKSVAMSQKAMLRLMPKIIAMTTESAAKVAPPARVEPVKERVLEAVTEADVPEQSVVPAPSGESGVSAVLRMKKPEMLMLLSHDGKRVRPLTDVPSHPTIGSPEVDPNCWTVGGLV